MSVRVNERSEGKLQVLRLADELSLYTFKACSNTHLFPKNVKFTLVDRMINTSFDISDYIEMANNTPLEPNFKNERISYQVRAIGSAKKLIRYINLAYDALDTINGNKVEHWTSMVENVIAKINNWMKSDKKRY